MSDKVEKIKEIVAQHFEEAPDDLFGGTSFRSSRARHMVAVLARRTTSHSVREIGMCLGRTGTVVLQAEKAIARKCSEDSEFAAVMSALERRVREAARPSETQSDRLLRAAAITVRDAERLENDRFGQHEAKSFDALMRSMRQLKAELINRGHGHA